VKTPRAEYPRPQFVREPWVNLNGPWTCIFDFGRSGLERGFHESKGFDRKIIVPFCPESALSGVKHTDFIDRMWYHRTIEVPSSWAGKKTLLHFGAVDYSCEAFIDGKFAGRHYGGSSSFTFDITALVRPGYKHNLVLHVTDETRSGKQPAGKQSSRYFSQGCHYTRVTGIWQTVWMEAVDARGLASAHVVPDFDGCRFIVTPNYLTVQRGVKLRAKLLDNGRKVSEITVPAAQNVSCELAVKKPKPWSPQSPFLYDILLEVLDARGKVIDSVKSYAGLRKVHIEGNRVFLNNEPIYLRLVLDQGFYPEGVWTAPSDAALRKDIEMSLAAGFNGARLHQKVFEERFHYWADKLGYLTWGESPSWGLSFTSDKLTGEAAAYPPEFSAYNFLNEWREVIVRDRNHPSIIAWTPFNETAGGTDRPLHARLHREAYDLTKALDATRPVNDSSGYVHVHTDLWTVHNYEQDPAKLKEQISIKPDGTVWRNAPEKEVAYEGQPYIVDEFGGTRWVPNEKHDKSAKGWGYGEPPQTIEEFYARLEGMVDSLLSLQHVVGYCYTQLTDVEQEQNGIYCYDRSKKFDMKRISRIFSKQPR
jgi:beta-galactosidase/beta-glucuronidase